MLSTNERTYMLIKIKLAVPKVDDPRLGQKGLPVGDVYVWINPEEIVSMQGSTMPGKFMILFKNGLTMPCQGDVDQVARDINTVIRPGLDAPARI